jgi:hypothetical protein
MAILVYTIACKPGKKPEEERKSREERSREKGRGSATQRSEEGLLSVLKSQREGFLRIDVPFTGF